MAAVGPVVAKRYDFESCSSLSGSAAFFSRHTTTCNFAPSMQLSYIPFNFPLTYQTQGTSEDFDEHCELQEEAEQSEADEER